jgi:hypothetical protein
MYVYIYKNWVVRTLVCWDTNSENIHDICMYVMMRKWTCIESNICVLNEYGFSITLDLKESWPKTSLWFRKSDQDWIFCWGGHETDGEGAWFSLLFALRQFKVLLVNAITINTTFNVNKVCVLTRLTSANGIHDRIAGSWIRRLALVNGIRDRISGRWITRLAWANDVRFGTPKIDW